jgi:hypothetical protein
MQIPRGILDFIETNSCLKLERHIAFRIVFEKYSFRRGLYKYFKFI